MVIINDTFTIFETLKTFIMDKNKFPSLKFWGIISNLSSCLMTIILCLPIPILFFFLQKRMTRIFSIYNSYTEFTEGEIELEKFSKKLTNTKIGLFVFAFVWLLITVLVYVNSDRSKMENILGNSVVILPIALTVPCIILCGKVNRYL